MAIKKNQKYYINNRDLINMVKWMLINILLLQRVSLL